MWACAVDVSEQIRSELEGFAAEERKNVSVLFAPAVNDQCWETRAETWLAVFDLLLKKPAQTRRREMLAYCIPS